ncbi:MAG: Mn2+ and Fe2+ transporter of the family [Chthonomonadaceae bacterium]|nr:Mn2+ and Fe2+ transporter of the family [Chthonomonadaceae bacterium]
MPEEKSAVDDCIETQGNDPAVDFPDEPPVEQELDEEDLVDARCESIEDKDKTFLQKLGPGLITGVADDDPSGIGTYSVAGAQFGYGLLWLVPVCIPLMIAVQEMCGRIGAVTGKGLAGVLKEHYPKWMLFGAVFLLIGANSANVYADLNVMAASARMLFGLPFHFWLAVITLTIILLQVFVPYRNYVKILKWLCLALLSYVVTAFWPTVHHNWREMPRGFIPHWQHSPEFILTVVGFLGTTISPYLFFWQAGETVEDEIAEGLAVEPGRRTHRVTRSEIRAIRTDTVIGMVASQVATLFIMICTAATLHATGKTDINTAQDAAMALKPLGPAAYYLFTIGILGTGLLAIPTLTGSAAYAVSETMGWRYGLYRRFSRADKFYWTIIVVTIAGYLLNFYQKFSPIKALLYSAVLNAVVAPPLIVLLLLICNNRKVMGGQANRVWSNVFGWLSVLLMGAAAGFMFYALASGKAH